MKSRRFFGISNLWDNVAKREAHVLSPLSIVGPTLVYDCFTTLCLRIRARRIHSFTLGNTPWPNSRSYEENTKRPVLVGCIRLVPGGLVHRVPKHSDANSSRTKKSPGL